jgi:hypothetical protein
MQWDWRLAVILAIALGAGLAWWLQPDRDSVRVRKLDAEAVDDRGSGHRKHAHGDEGPTLYRWVDDNGVDNITDHPPRGRAYTIVRIDPNRNIVHMSELISAARTTAKPASTTTH